MFEKAAEHHLKAGEHLENAARHHRLAAIHHGEGKHEEASDEMRLANGQLDAGLFHARQADAIEQSKASPVHA